MQYGYKRSDDASDVKNDDGTIIRFDNFPDHPEAPRHHKHLPDGSIEDVDFEGIRPLFHRFRTEVTENYGERWD